MKRLFISGMRVLVGAVLVLMINASPIIAETYKKKVDHKGRDVTPKEAYKLVQQDPKHTFIIDTRTQYEYQDVGHPEGAYNIPYEFYTDELPYMDDNRLREMRDRQPQEWQRLVQFDRKIREIQKEKINGAKITGTLYVHRSCKPIDEVDLRTAADHGQMDMFGEECEGMCGV